MMILHEMWAVVIDLAPWLLIGAGVAALLHYLVPPDFIRRQLSGGWGVVKAVLLGVPLPLCSCGVIPAALGLRKDGASSGSSIGFLIATPQTGVDSIMVSAGMLGWPFALTKVVAALITGVVGGWTTDAVGGEGRALEVDDTKAEANSRGLAAALEHGLDLLRMIWRWLAVGIVASALLSTYLPPDAFTGLTAQGLGLAFLAVLLISLPLYVCATASVPIAAALVAAGLPTGAAMVFLMAGPATNVATLGAVFRGFGRRALAVYLTVIGIGSTGFGLGYEALFGGLHSTGIAAHEHGSWWGHAAGILLVGMLIWFAIADLKRSWVAWRLKRAANDSIQVRVGGMSCQGCANRLSGVLSELDGVELATVSFDEGTAVVSGTVQPAKVEDAIKGAGFETV